MAKMTIAGLSTLASSYVAAAKQAGEWTATTANMLGLLDKIGKQVQIDGLYIDKLPEFDGEALPFGRTIEEFFIDLTLPEAYSTILLEGAKDVVPALPTVQDVAYSYTLGREKIKTTVPYNNVERAALSSTEAGSMTGSILLRLANSYEMFKYAAKKQLLGNFADKAVTAGLVATVAKPEDEATGEAFIKQIKNDVETASFAHEGGLNGALIGVAPELVLYIKKGVMSSIEVDTLAGAFNKDELALPAKVKVLDDFGVMTDTKVYAVLLDPRGIKLHRSYHVIREAPNGDGDFINYVDHSEHTGFISKQTFIKAYKIA